MLENIKSLFKNYLKQTTTLNHLFDTFVNFADKTMVENNYKMNIDFQTFYKD